jgi:hypothetical protein
MNLPVTLAGCPGCWRFRGSAALDAWLLGRPWGAHGGVRVVRAGSPGQAEELARAVRRTVRGHDDGDADVQVHLVPGPTPGLSLRGLLERVLELPPAADRQAYLRHAALAFSAWPTVIVVLPAGGGAADPRLVADARELADHVGQVVPHARATLVFLDTPTAPQDAEALDFTVGSPTDPVLGDPDRRDAAFWGGYVHARLAWEAAGDLARARAWDERGLWHLPYAADTMLENLFNQCAEAACQELPDDLLQELLHHLRHLVGPRTPVLEGMGAAPPALVQAGLFWRPVGEAEARPAPWLARALLRADVCPEAGFYLRAALVCAPLAREVLSRCFDLEARQRSIGWATRGTAIPPVEAEERFRKFQQGQPGSGAEHYPADCPAIPADAWAFTMFGEFLAALPLGRARQRHHHELRNLRNAVAHGHYVSWATLTHLRRIEKLLGC